MRPQRDLLRLLEKELKLAQDPDFVHELLRDNGAAVRAELGVQGETLLRIGGGQACLEDLRQLVGQALADREERRAGEARNLALAAAGMLSRLARWGSDRVDLEARIVLGSLLDDARARYLRFDAEGCPAVVVRRVKLREARGALKVFPDLVSFLDGRGLHFRWRGGCGGLVLTSQQVSRRDAELVLPVVLTRRHVDLTERPSVAHRVGDALREAAFL